MIFLVQSIHYNLSLIHIYPPAKRGVLFCGQKASRSLDYAVTGMFNTFYPNVFILFSIAFTPTIVFVDARLCLSLIQI